MPHPKGGYRLQDGTRVPGTTTIINRFKDSGGLMQWAFRQGQEGHEFLYEERDEAASVGTIAHSMVEQHVRGLAVEQTLQDFSGLPAEQVLKARGAFKAYLTWERHTQLEIVRQEQSLVCECHRFGGTLDAIGMIDLERCLLDWKTANGLYPDNLVQLAAYRHLWEVNHPEEQLTGGFHLIRFSKDKGDFAHHYFPSLDEAWRAFELMRELYDIDRELKKRAA
jgi:hypothetical protein